MSEICTRCGGADPLIAGQRECVADSAPPDACVSWSIALCRECALNNVREDRRTTIRMAPLKGALLTFLGLGICAVALISLTEPGWEKLWAVPFAFLGIPAVVKGVAHLVALPMALRQLGLTAANLEADTLTPTDRDLLLHLEAHRALQVLDGGVGFVHGGLRLPDAPDADPKSIKYQIRRPEAEGEPPQPGR
jgi:hypothetical protein